MISKEEIISSDLDWLSGIEQVALIACRDIGILDQFRESIPAEQMAAVTGIPERVLSALAPVVIHADPHLLDKPLIRPEALSRMKNLISGGEGFLRGTAASFTAMWSKGAIDLESARIFSKRMHDKTSPPAELHCARQPFAGIRTLADIGGGGGAWAIQMLKQHPNLQVTIFDLNSVNHATREILANIPNQIKERLYYSSGNFFLDELPSADGYLISQILHDWPLSTCTELLRRVHGYMPPHARLFIHECLLDRDKSGPKFTCIFNLLMLLNHSSQQFTLDELTDVLQQSGFQPPREISRVAHYSLLETMPTL